MAAKKDPVPPVPEMPTFERCLTNAARLLDNAEMELDLAKIKAYDELAASWAGIGALLLQKANTGGMDE